MNKISTHILDMVTGKPAANIQVRLQRKVQADQWQEISSTKTDEDGRCPQLLQPDQDLTSGTYRLIFETTDYFAARQLTSLYPFVEIAFTVREGESHFHIPLLLSPNGYTTYRGS